MNSFKLRIIFIIIAVVYLLGVTAVFAVDDGSNLGVEENVSRKKHTGVENLKMRIYKFDGKEMIQLRSLADKYGWSLHYDTMSKEIRIKDNIHSITLSPVNDRSIQFDNFQNGDSGGLSGTASGGDMDQLYPLIKDGRSYLSIKSLKVIFNKFEEKRLLTGLYTDKIESVVNEKKIAHLRLYNLSQESVRLNFGSGQRYDLYLLKDDQEVWRWSDGKFFTMALAQLEVKPGESLEYDVELPVDLETGEYILSGELATVPVSLELNEIYIEVIEGSVK